MSKNEFRFLFPECSVRLPDRRASLDIGNHKANNIDLWIKSSIAPATQVSPVGFGDGIIGPDSGRLTGKPEVIPKDTTTLLGMATLGPGQSRTPGPVIPQIRNTWQTTRESSRVLNEQHHARTQHSAKALCPPRIITSS